MGWRICGFAALLAGLLWGASAGAADRAYVNGRVWTGTDGRIAEAFAVSGERITAVGTSAEVRAGAGGAEIVDLQGRFVAPGFIDNHTHFMIGAASLTRVHLRDAATREEFSRRIAAAAAANPGKWITHGDWDHELWGGALPTRDWIDAATGRTPVFVTRLDGHMALANAAALQAAGVNERTADPAGGQIVRDASGRPTGLLKDAAMELVRKVVPPPSEEERSAALKGAVAHALAHGVTQIHDMGEWEDLALYRKAQARGDLRIRVYAFTPLAEWQRLADLIAADGRGDDRLRWGGVKGFVDGSLGSTTAWFYAPYSDAPDTSGFTVIEPSVLADRIRQADRHGLHVTVHAIGDRANDWLLDTYQDIAREAGARDRRFRIEHAQHLSPNAPRRFRELGVIPSMQPYHAIDDGRWAEKRIGAARIKGTYAFRSLLDARAPLSFGSDWTVAPLDPIQGIYAAVTRRTIDGRNPAGWVPEQKIGVEEALRAYTAANAYAGFQEDRLGRIATGFLADFVILSDDLLTIPPERIGTVRVLRTIVGGREEYVAP